MFKKATLSGICIFMFLVCNLNAKDINDIPKKSIAHRMKGFDLPQFSVKKGGTMFYEMPAWKGKNAVIDFYARIDEEPKTQQQGFHALAIKINGKVVRSRYEGEYMTDNWYGRLINKPFFMAGSDGKRRGTFHWKFYWNVFRSKSFEPYVSELNGLATDKERAQMFHLVIDVTDFLKADSNNLIEFITNRAQKYESDIIIKDFFIREFSEKERCQSQSNLEKPLEPVAKGVFTDYSKVPYEVKVNKDGSIKIRTGDNNYMLESIISYPGKFGNGLVQNKYVITPEKEWTVTTEKVDNKHIITAQGDFYKLVRTLNIKRNSIEVVDSYTNKTDKELGIFIDNFFTTGQKVEARHLAGVPIQLDKAEREENIQTSVLALNKDGGLGIIAKNHINRSNAVVYMDGSRFGIRKNAVLFAPKAEHTLEWDIVPVEAGGDYFDFINVVRNNWNVNFELPAVLLTPRTDYDVVKPVFIDGIQRNMANIATMSEEELRAYLYNCGGEGKKYVLFASTNRDQEVTDELVAKYGKFTDTVQGGDNLNANKYYKDTKEIIKKMKKADPNAKAIAFFCIYISSEEPDVIKANYPDGYLKDKKGNPVLYQKREDLYSMRLTIGNSYAKKLDEVFDYFYNKIGFDGIYFDICGHSKPQWDYVRWDGISGALTKDYQIDFKMDDSAISSEDYKNALYKKMLADGRCLWANIQTTSLMNGIRFPQQVETGYWDYIYRSHAFSPIAWHEVKNAAYIEDLAYNIRMALRLGALSVGDRVFIEAPDHPTSYSKMYPMVPKELQEGYILGTDKIVTIRKGKFGWKENECNDIKAFVFDKHEKPVERKSNIIIDNGYRLIDIELEAGDLAVLERAS